MFSKRTAAVLSTAALGLSMLAPGIAGAQGDVTPELVEHRTYFLCDDGPTPVTTINGSGTPTWGDEEPTGGTADTCGTPAGTNGFDPMAWEGTFTGNVDTLAIELHQIAPQNALYGDISITVTLFVDGTPVAAGEVADPRTNVSDTGLSYQVDLGFKNLGLIEDKDGPSDIERTYRLEVVPNFVDSGAIVGWIWGSADSPSGIEFNGDTKRTSVVN